MGTPITLLLRFRDLTPSIPGSTIKEHSSLIAANGYAWWAWWKKQSEKVPYALWDELVRQIGAHGPATAYLVDSGQRKLYRTTILEIECRPGKDLVPAPEGGARTPEYYRKDAHASWFKLGPIEEVGTDQLATLAWREIPHDDLIAFDRRAFEDRRVAGIGQLLQFGNITYWVATPATDASLPPNDVPIAVRVPPPIAPRDLLRAERARILHISDVHLSTGHHAFPATGGDAHNLTMARAIFQALGNQRLPGVVVVTGDLTWTGSADEFALAFESLDELRAALGLSRQDFVIVPGNHDLQWTPKQAAGKKYVWDGAVEVASADARKNYAAFFQRWYGTEANPWLSIGRRFFMVGGPTIDFLGLNSSELQQRQNVFAGMGRVTTEAFEKSATQLGWDDEARATDLRIVCLHHHLLPVISIESAADSERGFGVALDAEAQLVRCTQRGVDLVLHGHQHQPYAGYVQRQAVVGPELPARGVLLLGCGSSGVVDEHLGPIKHRCFNLIDTSRHKLSVSCFETSATHREFSLTSQLQSSDGAPWQRVK